MVMATRLYNIAGWPQDLGGWFAEIGWEFLALIIFPMLITNKVTTHKHLGSFSLNLVGIIMNLQKLGISQKFSHLLSYLNPSFTSKNCMINQKQYLYNNGKAVYNMNPQTLVRRTWNQQQKTTQINFLL